MNHNSANPAAARKLSSLRISAALPSAALAAILLAAALLSPACSRADRFDAIAAGKAEAGGIPRESILDRVTSVTPELITEIPPVERWCDRLPALRKHRIDSAGARLYVEDEGRGIPLVLINGGPGGTHHYFHPWFSAAARFSRIVYYDQRGCGLSDFKPGPDGYSVEQAVEDLEAVRRGLGIERWAVLGYSYGGFLAQYYAALHPESVRGLILLGASPGMWASTGPAPESYVSKEERARLKAIRDEVPAYAKEHGLPPDRALQVLLYNNFLNGDWKRQSFYRPSPARLSQIALYEWVNDDDFNNRLNQSENRIDLTGVFAACALPTLILEGKYDLTWGAAKRDLLRGNHPRAEMVLFERSSHGIYDEEPENFFATVERFVRALPRRTEAAALAAFKDHVAAWRKELAARPETLVAELGWGRSGSRKVAAAYTPGWLDQAAARKSRSLFMRLGFALYDEARYADALAVFERYEAVFGADAKFKAFGLLWQGHMLDLLGRRAEALVKYRAAAAMNVTDGWMHGQYGLTYEISPAAKEGLKTPFARIENSQEY